MISSISGTSSLTQSYMTQMRQQMFSKIDTNGDGKHDKDELAAMVAKGPQGGPSVDDILSQFDSDGDGAISESEFEAASPPEKQMQGAGFPPMMGGMGGMSSADFLEQMFGNADADGDEQISMEEMITAISNAPAGGPTAEEIFDKLDTNKDGYVSKAEFDAGHAQESGSVQASNTEEELLQALLEVLQNEDSTTSSSTDDASENNSTITNLLASLKAYMQTSVNGFAQYDETQSLLGSMLYA
jgi:Ca2+-binding EF-hand superfamily protein